MLVSPFSETETGVKSIIAWASISYAFGFATVTLHTYRLGLPVLEVLSAVYIWIGLPLALVAFFGRSLALFFKARALGRATQLRESWRNLTSEVDEEDLDIVAASFRIMVTFFPL